MMTYLFLHCEVSNCVDVILQTHLSFCNVRNWDSEVSSFKSIIRTGFDLAGGCQY